jgi:hypothetical protein
MVSRMRFSGVSGRFSPRNLDARTTCPIRGCLRVYHDRGRPTKRRYQARLPVQEQTSSMSNDDRMRLDVNVDIVFVCL